MVKLGVNIDHIATLRQARREFDPDPVLAARLCEQAGCDSIVAHLREDRRHIQDRDIVLLRKTLKIRFNLEMSIRSRYCKNCAGCQAGPGDLSAGAPSGTHHGRRIRRCASF